MAISGSNDISLLQMGIGLLPVGISLFLSWKYKLGLSKSLIIGVVRGTIQLVAVGYILLWAFRQSDPWVLAALILFFGGGGFRVRFKTLGRSPECKKSEKVSVDPVYRDFLGGRFNGFLP